MNNKKVTVIISILLLIISICLTIFTRVYSFPKAGTDFVDFLTHFYDMKKYYDNNTIPTVGARFQMGPLTQEVAPRVPGGFFYIHYLMCYKLAHENIELARVFNFVTMFLPAIIFLLWVYKRFGISIMSILSVLTLFNVYFVYTNNIFYNPNITLSLSFLLIPLLGEYIIGDRPYIPAMMFFPLLALMGQAHFAVYYGIVPTIIVYLIIRYKYTIKNIKALSVGVFLAFLTYLPYLVSEIKNGFYNTNKMLNFSATSDLRQVFPFPQVHSLLMFPTNEFSVMYSANNFTKIMSFYLNNNPFFVFTLAVLIISILVIFIAFLYSAINFFKNKQYKFDIKTDDKLLFLTKELMLIFLLYFPVTIAVTFLGRGVSGQFRYHFGAFSLSFVPMLYLLYNLSIRLKYKYINYLSIFYMLSALAMTFNIVIFYKNYQEPYKWKSYIDTVQNIANDADGEKFIIENGSHDFSQMGFVYNKKGYWNEVTNDANIIYHLESSNNNTNIINLPIISSNNIYIVYKEQLK
ncbi:hypothetical protein [Brachyspira murdochii]|uniref:Glycosyltransferase RgtA/B/C/D-like domain-containing protein n=1 Tax=Brachyspira murdochii (strain ATCC 51284 / DSM 12563 / 56-150) TaxID=526224 RepID=D5U6E9_BRAM5|nr:hypothetical protein [Brachyspira murdochii]ADG72648.1 hypothetical protein Bmur_2579 [Brachyspira murdochii DSM 12563]